MARTAEISVKVLDLPEVKAYVDEVNAQVERMRAVVEAALKLADEKDACRSGPERTIDDPLEPERYKRWAEESLAVIDAFFAAIDTYRRAAPTGGVEG